MIKVNKSTNTVKKSTEKMAMEQQGHPNKRQKMDFKTSTFEESKFENLPNEVLLKIFSLLPIKSLFCLMTMNKRIRSVANDESLWMKMHLFGHGNTDEFPPEFLKKIVEKGCQYLALDCCSVKTREVKFEMNFTLKYLSFDRCGETPGEEFDILPDFAASCYGLEKFYVKRSDSEKNPRLPIIDSKFFKCIIQCSGTLRVLNLADCSLNLDEVKHIVTLCLELRELNINAWGFAWEHDFLCEDSIDFLCKNLTTKIEKLNLSGQPHFADEHLRVLVERCNKLTELVFGNCEVTDKSVDVIIKNLSKTLVKLYCWSNPMSSLRKLAAMPHLKVLAEPNGNEDFDEDEFRKLMPQMPEDYMSVDIKIAEPYDFFDEKAGMNEWKKFELFRCQERKIFLMRPSIVEPQSSNW